MSEVTDSGAVVALLAATGQQPDEWTVFMGALIEQSRRDYVHTTGSLIDSLSMEVAELRARLECISISLEDVMASDYMPGPVAIARCLYPSREAVAERTSWHLAQGGTHSSTLGKGGHDV